MSGGPERVRTVVVDDQRPFRAAAAAVLRRCPEFELVGEAASGEEAVTLATATAADLVLMDLRMPGPDGTGMDGLAAGRALAASAPGTVVLLCTSSPVADLPEGWAADVAAHLLKEELAPERLRALWEAHRPR